MRKGNNNESSLKGPWAGFASPFPSAAKADAGHWTPGDAGTRNDLWRITCGKGLFLVVGYDYHTNTSVILTSHDGATWTKGVPMLRHRLFGIAYACNTFVAVGECGAILTSHDGIHWTRMVSRTENYLFSATYGKDTFLAVGEYGTILTAPGRQGLSDRWAAGVPEVRDVPLQKPTSETDTVPRICGTIVRSGNTASPLVFGSHDDL